MIDDRTTCAWNTPPARVTSQQRVLLARIARTSVLAATLVSV